MSFVVKCDRCGYMSEDRRARDYFETITIANYGDSAYHRWDLCPSCMKTLVELVEKHNG